MKRLLLGLLDHLGLLAQAVRIRDRIRYLRDEEKRARDARFAAAGAPDDLPVPPLDLIYLVSGQCSSHFFYHNGVEGAQAIRRILAANDVRLEELRSILDFGCGCGRVMRHWKDLEDAELHGSDVNPRLVDWCRRNLDFATFATNRLKAQTDYSDGQFDLIYAISVFTHLDEPHQEFWMAELTRILAPEGFLLFTVHGPSRLGVVTAEERRRFNAGEFVLRHNGYVGKNLCSAFHPMKYIREKLCRKLMVLDYIPDGAPDARQDAVLVRKPQG